MQFLEIIGLIIQSVSTIVVAVATVVYTFTTVRILESGIEPSLDFGVTGGENQDIIVVTNDAGCSIDRMDLSVSVGYRRDGIPSPVRRCIHTETFDRLKPGASARSRQLPSPSEIESLGELMDGSKADPCDLILDYSFVRRADKRRFCFQLRGGVALQKNNTFFYSFIGKPQKIETLKQFILKPKVDEQE